MIAILAGFRSAANTARVASFAGVFALAACNGDDPSVPPVSVRFVIDAPFCGLTFPVAFSIDGAVVGTDTFRVHLPPNHVESKVFSVAPGAHILGATTFGGFTYAWRDTTINAKPGASVVDSLGFYCS